MPCHTLDRDHAGSWAVSQLVSPCLRLGYFGLAEVRQFEIGAALWGGQWDAAARLLLTANRAEALRPAAKEKSFAACQVHVTKVVFRVFLLPCPAIPLPLVMTLTCFIPVQNIE